MHAMLPTTHTVLVLIASRTVIGSAWSVNMKAPTRELRHRLGYPSQEDWDLEQRPQFAGLATEQEQITGKVLGVR